MREGKIIVPIRGNAGECLAHVHNWLARNIVSRFGGATVTDGAGAWVDPNSGELHNDPVKVFHVAAADAAENNATLRSLAITAGEMAREKAMYFVGFDGTVSIEAIEAVAMAA